MPPHSFLTKLVNMKLTIKKALISFIFLNFSAVAHADTVITDDLIVPGSLCAGPSCEVDEVFDYDTLKLKSDAPQIVFDDTSSTSSFPNVDWQVGVQGSSSDDPGAFFIENSTAGQYVLQISSDGDVALGGGSEVVDGAISFGSSGYERRISYVADGVDATDAVTLGQFQSYVATLNLDSETSTVQKQVAALQKRINDLTSRVEALAENLE